MTSGAIGQHHGCTLYVVNVVQGGFGVLGKVASIVYRVSKSLVKGCGGRLGGGKDKKESQPLIVGLRLKLF